MRYLFLVFLLLMSLYGQPVLASAVNDTIALANDKKLGVSPTWLALLHYKKETISRRVLSQADDSRFFLAETGKVDSVAELEADITGFMQAPALNHAQCRFPARWHWLKGQLSLSSAQYDVPCPKLAKWMKKTDADQLTLVFPAMYLNDPGSMFGHTFLRFDNSKKSILLSYTLNYAAKAGKGDGLFSYAYNGLIGGYNGIFAIRPYYETVQLYSDIENRDIWEYQLDYSQAEITQILRHVWEITGMQFDYFFLNENCAYRLLAILDSVKPQAKLSSTASFPVYVIPVDTVRALDKKALIIARQFRPSLATQIEHNRHNLSSMQNELALELASQHLSLDQLKRRIVSKEQRAAVIDQAYVILGFRKQTDLLFATQLLSERNKLPKRSEPHYSVIPPEEGHKSVLAAIGYGKVRDRKNIRLELRPAFHSLLDDPTGYVAGAEITTFDTELNLLTEKNTLQLETFTLFNIAALAPLKDWQKPMSWRFNIKLDRTPLNATATTLAFVTAGSAGVSVKLADIIYFALADIAVEASHRYTKGYSTLLGWSSGLVYPFTLGQLKLEYQDVSAFSGANIDRATTSAKVNFNISRVWAIEFGYERSDYDVFDVDEWEVQSNWYF